MYYRFHAGFRFFLRRAARLALAASVAAAAIAVSGCSLGYVSLHPGENSGLYTQMFADVISHFDEPHWLWVRGSVTADIDGDGKVEEEAVIATIQKGDLQKPGPIEAAFLVVCKKTPGGERVAMARTMLFDRHPFEKELMTVNDIGMLDDIPLTKAKAQVVQSKMALGESIVVYFWGDDSPTSVWYAGYHFDDGELRNILETVVWQTNPGFAVANLDKRLEARDDGYQLLFPVAAIPPGILAKVAASNEMPVWGHVFATDKDGVYRQADERFGNDYHRLEGDWNQAYLKAVVMGMPSEELAWFEYHLALLNRYTGNQEMAERFLAKAAKYAADPRLAKAVADAESLVFR